MDGFKIFSDSWPDSWSNLVDLVGSGELSTEKLWSQVSEATVGWTFVERVKFPLDLGGLLP